MTRSVSDLTPKQQHWLSHIVSCRESGQSVREYARKHRLSGPQLYTWTSRLRALGALDWKASPRPRRPRREAERKSLPSFSAVRVVADSQRSPREMRIVFANGVVLELGGPGAPEPDLLRLLASLP